MLDSLNLDKEALPLIENQGLVPPGAVKMDELNSLEHLAKIESGDIVERIEQHQKINEAKNEAGSTFYRNLLYALIGVRLNEKDAKRDWQDILVHKLDMSTKLGRNIGIKVASLDYYTNIKRTMKSPKILEVEEYAQTVRDAISDNLTHAYNRRYFDFFIRNLFLRSRDKNDKSPFSLLMVDVDHFKYYNDARGHIAGDLALIEITRIINAVTQKHHVVARYGGEEFAVLMPGADEFEAYITASNIKKAVFDFRFPGENKLPLKRLSVSVGTSTYNQFHKEPLEIIAEADKALYRAKEEGRNRVISYKEITSDINAD
ncbi:MAG: GGDEF domain-containing protein [bacterium]